MAFTFRTAEENFISALPSKVADIFYSDYFESMQDDLRHLNTIFPFALSAQAKEYIAERGIRVSPFGSQTHSHPISKIFENHFLYNVLPSFIQDDSHLAIFSIKEKKTEYLYYRAKSFDVSVVNKFLLAQDYGRYSNKSTIPGGYSNFESFVHNLVPRFHKRVPDLIFFHDELMHWSLDDFLYFIARIKPINLAFTFVFPAELLVGVTQSCNSMAYDFEVIDGSFYYFPDRSRQSPYQHSGSLDWPFHLNEINVKVGNEVIRYTLDLVESHGAHHFFILKQGTTVTQKKRFFRDFDCTHFSQLCIDSSSPRLNGVIRTKMLAKVFNYLTCLKKKDVESALAKLRQLSEGKLLDDELTIINDLAVLLSKYSITTTEPSLLDWLNPLKFRDNIKLNSKILDFFLGTTPTCVKARLRELSRNIKPLAIVIDCHKIEVSFDVNVYCPDGSRACFSDYIKAKQDMLMSRIRGGFKHVSKYDVSVPVCRVTDFDDSSDSESSHETNSFTSENKFDRFLNDSVNAIEVVEPKTASGGQIEPIKLPEVDELDMRIQRWTSSRKNGCFLTAICSTIRCDPFSILTKIEKFDEVSHIHSSVLSKFDQDLPLSIQEIEHVSKIMSWRVWVYLSDDIVKLNDQSDLRPISIGGREGHLFKLNDLKFFNCLGLLEKSYFELFGIAPLITKYKPNIKKAKSLLESFSTMLLGALIDKRKVENGSIVEKETLKLIRADKMQLPFNDVNIVPFLGFAGSGKTRSLFNLVNSSFLEIPFLWISPRAKVLKELISKIDKEYGDGHNVSFTKQFITFEKALLLPELPELIIIDEAPLLPPGYIDLLLCKAGVSHRTSIGLIGDPLQCRFHCQDHLLMHKAKIDFFEILNARIEKGMQTDYLYLTHRFGPHKILSFIPSSGNELTIRRLKVSSDESEAILVASDRDKRNMGGDLDPRVMTIGESQGCNFSHCSLVLTDDLNLCDIGTLITGLTRAKSVLEIICDPIKIEFFLSYKRGANNCAFIATFNANQLNSMCSTLLHGLTLHKITRAGADFEEKLAGDPFLKSLLNMVPRIEVEPYEQMEPEVIEPFPKTHLPLVECMPFEIECFEKIRAREYREFWVHGTGWSSQFEDTLLPRKSNPALGPAFNPQNVFPRHKADDSVTFWAAVKKRLFFSNPTTQLQKFKASRDSGREIFRIFLKRVPLSRDVMPLLMEEAISEFEEKKVSKSAALIANHAIRSDSDWDERNVFLFMKSQLCKKKEKMFCDAKAGQTLACFSHAVLVKFSGVCRYIEKKLMQVLPENFYVHQKKDFREFEKWVIRFGFDSICTESDYEAFDASQDHVALAFEVALMEHLCFNQEVIDDYIFIKTHLYCKLGEFAIMRFTGEFCTFLFNTLVNMAYTFLKYDVKAGTAICFAGDDMCANKRLAPNSTYSNLLDLMTLKAKVEFTRVPTFCGWFLSDVGIVKCPFLMCARLQHAIYKGELHLVIDSYFLEFCFAYEKKDNLLNILSERDLDFHYLLTRFFVQKAAMLKGSARLALQSTREQDALMFGEAFGADHDPLIRSMSRPMISNLLDSALMDNVRAARPNLLNSIKPLDFGLHYKMELNGFDFNLHNIESMKKKRESQRYNGALSELFAEVRDNKILSLGLFNHLGLEKIMPLTHLSHVNHLRTSSFNVPRFAETESYKNCKLAQHFKVKLRNLFDLHKTIFNTEVGSLDFIKWSNHNAYHRDSLMRSIKSTNIKLIKELLTKYCSVLRIKGDFLENIRWPLSTKRNLLISQVEQAKKFLSMALGRAKSTQILEYLSPRLLMLSSDFRSILLSLFNLSLGSCTLMFHSSIKWSLITSKALMTNTACCISQLYCFPSRDSFHQLKPLREKCSYLMQEALKCAPPSKMALLSIYKRTLGLITCIAQITWCPFQMLDCKRVLSLDLNSLVSISKKVLMPFTSTSGSCTDFSIIQMTRWSMKSCVKVGFKSCKLAINFQILAIKLTLRILSSLAGTTWRALGTNKLYQAEEAPCHSKVGQELVGCGGTVPNHCLTSLSVAKLKLITSLLSFCARVVQDLITKVRQGFQLASSTNFLREMSARKIFNENLALELKDYLWTNIVDPQNTMALIPAVDVQLTQPQQARKNLIMDHFLKNLFGNIAVEGASDKVSFLNMTMHLPPLESVQGEPQAHLALNYNLLNAVGAIRSWRDNNVSETIRNLTFRACCRPFADYAMDFLLENPTVRTNLYFSQPHHYGRAPEVAFDFADGLSINRLANNRDRQFVMSALAARTFNHESKKGVFEAQGAVNFTFDG